MAEFMDELDSKERLKGDKKIPTGVLLGRILKYIRPELPRFILAGSLILLNVILDVILPLITKGITENITSDDIRLSFLIGMAIAYFAICICNNIFLYIESMVLQKAGQSVICTLREDVFGHIEEMSQNQFTEMPVGSLVTRVTSYTQSMSDLFTNVIVSVIKNVVTLIGVYVVMFFINWRMSLILLVPVTVVFVTSLIFSKKVGVAFRNERKKLSDLNTFMNENLSGMKITQIFNREEKKLSEFDEKNNGLRNATWKVILCFGIYRPFITFVYIATIALSFRMGIILGFEAAAVVAFYLYIDKFFQPVQQLADQLNNIQKALSASERLFNLLDVKPEVRDVPDAVEPEHFDGKIEFRNVWFAYEKENWILKDVSFTVEPGQTCAFVGATGAGKTTILSLIVRNYEIQKGQILIDGTDISKIKIKALRKAVGQMLQDVFLFSGTVKTNISLHDESIPDEKIKAACEYVGADSFISKLQNGYDEEVIERGENFSQGQRQLMSFARTVLHEPQILILDEATANIDTETEVLIQQSLEKMRSIGTMLVVAHRLSTIQHADNIIVLQNGCIIEQGNHQQLLAKRGYYYKLYELQFENGVGNN
ncbi:MAG: ABC transporter ATP-binding protein/permease [Clostridia bacterium]|nr:ABC transporter ATP-binding protein/permease [Clostridia bacterium]